MIAALDVVVAELAENAQRIKAGHASWVTFGDWATNKAALAGLSLRDPKLWQDVVEAYGQTYAWQQNPGSARPPTPEHLTRITRELMEQRKEFQTEVGAFSQLGAR
jgi:hypothetical protein